MDIAIKSKQQWLASHLKYVSGNFQFDAMH